MGPPERLGPHSSASCVFGGAAPRGCCSERVLRQGGAGLMGCCAKGVLL